MAKNKNSKSKSNKVASVSKTVKAKKAGVGRPEYQPSFPRKTKWTFKDFCAANSDETGKMKCAPLTLRNFITNDNARKGHSVIILVKDEKSKILAENGLGRKPLLYSLRSKLDDAKMEPAMPIVSKTIVEPTKQHIEIASHLLEGNVDNENEATVDVTMTDGTIEDMKSSEADYVKENSVQSEELVPAGSPHDDVSDATKAYEATKAALGL